MKNLEKYFIIGRTFRVKQVELAAERDSERKGLKQYTGSPYYIEKYRMIDENFTKKTAANREEATAKIKEVCNKMRLSLKKNLVEAPTPEMAATLGLLKLADKLDIREVVSFAESFKDCPLALKILKQIALPFSIVIQEPNFDIMHERVDRLEGGAYHFIGNFTDPAENSFFNMTYSRYFMSEEDNKSYGISTEQSEAHWLHRIVGTTGREFYEDNTPTPTPKVEYSFKSLDELLDYTAKATAGMDERDKELIKEEIFSNTPESQTAKYRNYLATGEKLPFEN